MMFGVKKTESKTDNGVEDWSSYMAAKKSKLEAQYRELVDKEFQGATTLFKGVAIFVNGWTNPCADELRRLMMTHGGVYHNYQRPNGTTHLIASNLPYSKIIQYRKSKNPLPLCKPEWIVDSIKANKLLDWRLYLLYSSQSITQPQLQFGDKINSLSTMINEEITLDSMPSTSFVSHSTKCNEKLPILSKSNTIKPELSMNVKETARANGGALSSKNDEFLTEFYNNSRLHHIATMGATFKEYVNELRSKSTGSFYGLERLKQSRLNIPRKSAAIINDSDSDEDLFSSPELTDKKNKKESIIMHIDMDCFFVSVGLKKKPELKGLPVAVTHARGNKPSTITNENEEPFQSMAEIASCSYEARKSGLKNGMFLGQALKLCPNLKTIQYDFEDYKEVSYILYNTIASYTLDIEAVSCDEMYADISTILYECNLTPLEFAEIIRNEIKEKTGCPVSTGFGSNKLQARLATKQAKPDGQFHLKNENVQSYIGSIKVGDIPGVGYTTMNQLKKMNVHICSDLQEISLGILQKEFGKKTGEMLYNTCRGIDSSKLNTEHVRKSVSSEVNYGIRFENDKDAYDFLKKLSKEVVSRLTKVNAKGKCITLKLMVRAKDAPVEPAKFMGHGLCDNYTKSKNLLKPTDDEAIVTKEVFFLWEQLHQPAHEIRGIGIQISRLETLKKHSDTYMMKFIAKAKQPMSNSTSNEIETAKKSSESTSVDKKSQLSNINSNDDNNNARGLDKKREKNLSKHQNLKTFFTAKNCEVPSLKSNGIFSNFPTQGEIDEAVLAELPEDIKMEIVNYHKENKNKIIDKQKEHAKDEQSLESGECNEKNFPLSQEIDESVLRELPLDIRDEILACTKNTSNKSATVQSKKVLQTLYSQPENYFKKTKPQKCNKTKLPDIEQLDMKVLVELPDDIRNEILNHYKTNQNNVVENNSASHSQTVQVNNNVNNNSKIHEQNVKNILDEQNVSYSQIDPEFLTALSEDMKDDVKMYCMAMKNERQLKLKKITNSAMEAANIPIKGQNLVNLKKRGRKPKTLKNNVLSKPKLVSKTKVTVNKINKAINGDEKQVMSRNRSFLEHEINILQNNVTMCDRRNDIKSHRSSFRGDVANTDEHQEMLENLVNHLFNLPLRQVKNQIETWISKSQSVNEIDVISITTFLSMLPKEKRIEDLHILMRTMHRCMTEIGSCVWHETYSRTVKHVQHYMQIQYNSNLMLPPIRCNLRECKSNHV
ncbi:hypothetical protein PV325_009828 [Microctonus aethiopoides]|nr:hypothetical protein PV325_009828 [Microctonus aethiopoides]